MTDKRQPDNVKKAQADSSPELSSILKEMKNGYDIQPLDDMQSSDFIKFEDNVTENNKTEYQKTEKRDKPFTENEKNDKKIKKEKIIRTGIIAALAICAAVAICVVFFQLDKFSAGVRAIYEKESSVNILLDNNDIVTLEDVADIKLSDDGKTVAYAQDSDSKTGKYDIRVIDFSKRSSVKVKGSVIVNGINENWHMDKTGSFVYYCKEEKGSKKYYAYSTQDRDSELIVADTSDYFAPPMGDIVYYTRERSGVTMLYRVRFGEETESLGDVSNVKAVSNDEKMEIFYTVADEETKEPTLYKISGDGQPIKIADKVSEVYIDKYSPGDNLYYFVKNDARFNWSDFIDDPYLDSDAAAKKPDKNDYMVTIGFFFKRTKLNETAYNRAVKEYNKKLKRDEIRLALDNLDLGLALATEYKVKVYDGQLSKELASSVKLDNLVAFAQTGAPRIIYKTSGIDADKKLDMNSLYNIATKKTVDDAIDLVISTLDDDYEISTGYKYSWYDGNKVLTYDFAPEGDAEETEFVFGSRKSFFTCVTTDETVSTLYANTVSEKEISASVLISDNVISFESKGDSVYFTKLNSDQADLYTYSAESGSVLICPANIQFIVRDDNSVIAFNGIYKNGNTENTEIMIYKDGETETVDKDISLKHFCENGESFAYIKNFRTAAATDDDAPIGGELMLYSEGKTDALDTDVTAVYIINIQ